MSLENPSLFAYFAPLQSNTYQLVGISWECRPVARLVSTNPPPRLQKDGIPSRHPSIGNACDAQPPLGGCTAHNLLEPGLVVFQGFKYDTLTWLYSPTLPPRLPECVRNWETVLVLEDLCSLLDAC
jgi:hypothetical protein